MTKTLLLRLAAPQQSWGAVGSSDYRTTETAPTRSGITGLLCAALGQSRGDIPAWMSDLDILTRVDKPGRVEWDFQTIGLVPDDLAENWGRWARIAGRSKEHGKNPSGPVTGQIVTAKGEKPSTLTMITRRAYLADAEFLVAITGDGERIEELHAALRRPVFSPYLGRKAFAPTFPFILGTTEGEGIDALREAEYAGPRATLRVLSVTGSRAAHVDTIDFNSKEIAA